MSATVRAAPGTRPATPVRQVQHPDDRWCSWVYREDPWVPGQRRTGFWELKYIHAACLAHARLPAA